MTLHRIVVLVLSLFLGNSALAAWQLQYKSSMGVWTDDASHADEKVIRERAEALCKQYRKFIRIINTDSGQEQVFHCSSTTGKLTEGDPPPPAILITEQEATNRASKQKAICQGNSFMSSAADCSCLEGEVKAELQKHGPGVSDNSILKKVTHPISAQCFNRQGLFNYYISSCLDIMKLNRPNDFDQFCRCSINATVDAFAKDRRLNSYYLEILKKAAMKQCG